MTRILPRRMEHDVARLGGGAKTGAPRAYSSRPGPRLRQLGEVAGLVVYLVSGERVRDEIDIDFTEGGNEAVYTYIPEGEIWIDDAAHALDRTATALHEIVERDLMLHHRMDYDRAHDAASARERAFRRELARDRPARFDSGRVADAYRAYLDETRTTRRRRRGTARGGGIKGKPRSRTETGTG